MKTVTRRRLTLTGVKPRVTVQWRFKAFYAYGLVDPLTGDVDLQLHDQANTTVFQAYLEGFAARHPEDFHVIQVDNAPFHCSKDLLMPDNVMLLYQPPHSPQVNPAERLWQWAKGQVANRLFEDLAALKATVKDLFASQSNDFFASLTHRDFICHALEKTGQT